MTKSSTEVESMSRRTGQSTAQRERARAAARERAAGFLAREERLLELAAEHGVVQESLSAAEERVEEKVARIREQAEERVLRAREESASEVAEARQHADSLMRQMLEVGATRREVAERLGVPTREVPRARPVEDAAPQEPPADTVTPEA